MTQMVIGLLWAVVLLVSPAQVSADQATYIYDDLGRLVQVIDGQGNVATITAFADEGQESLNPVICRPVVPHCIGRQLNS